MRSSRGYSLIELSVALAIASIVAVAALTAFTTFTRHRVRIERASTADDIAKIVVQYLVRESQRIGGSVLRPWQAIAVEQDPCGASGDNFPCVAGDRITFAFIDETAAFSACQIENLSDTSITFARVTENGITACCNLFRVSAGGDLVVIPADDLRNEHLMLSSTGRGGTSEERFKAITYADSLGGATSSCTFNYVESRQAFPLASSPRPPNSVFAPASGSGGFITFHANAIPIKLATAYIGCSTDDCVARPEDRALFLFSDRDAGASTTLDIDNPGDDNFVVSPNVVDLQVALGYDNDEDGEVIETSDGIGDDYAGNVSPARTADPGTGTPALAAVNPRLLRMISIGVIAAVKVNDPTFTSQAMLPGGDLFSATGLYLRPLRSKASFRSLNLLE